MSVWPHTLNPLYCQDQSSSSLCRSAWRRLWSLWSSRSWRLSRGHPGWISCINAVIFLLNYSQQQSHKPCWYNFHAENNNNVPLQPTIHQISVLHISPGGELLQNVGRQAYRTVIHRTACTHSLSCIKSWNNSILRLQNTRNSCLISGGFSYDHLLPGCACPHLQCLV